MVWNDAKDPYRLSKYATDTSNAEGLAKLASARCVARLVAEPEFQVIREPSRLGPKENS